MSGPPLAAESVPLLDVCNLIVRFRPHGNGPWLTVVDRVSLTIAAGQTLGLVGESGSGKTTLARAILRLIPAAGGQVRLAGRDVLSASATELRDIRRVMQVVFQDPYASLNPRHRIGDIVAEGLAVHRVGEASERPDRVAVVLRRVGLSAEFARRFPHELSGGQRQRVAIARALVLEPRLVICDEPVSALDVSVQAQILNLLAELQAERGISYLFIGHNLGTIRQISARIAVMQRGRIVELGEADQILHRPQHAYTQSLVASVLEPPVIPDVKELQIPA